MTPFNRAAGAAAAAAFAVLSCGAAALAQPNITVTINGSQMSFPQPPVMRNNSVFVPMRAIFERLGATVAYSNGDINATTRNGRGVHLHIGSRQATIGGQNMTLSTAPFVIAGVTEVPLRFVAQSLGAAVNWNGNTDTVSITTNGNAPSANYTPQPQNNASFYLKNMHPDQHANTIHPRLHAAFSEPVNQGSLSVTVDGRDETPQVYANSNGFDLTPNFPLNPGTHRVTVRGTTSAGASFNTGWSFTTSNGAQSNTISALSPSPGSRVSGGFTLSGHTLPNSKVHIVASGQAAAFGGLLSVNTGTFQTDTTADGSGHFSAQIGGAAPSGGQLRVIITSTAPSGASVERSIIYSV